MSKNFKVMVCMVILLSMSVLCLTTITAKAGGAITPAESALAAAGFSESCDLRSGIMLCAWQRGDLHAMAGERAIVFGYAGSLSAVERGDILAVNTALYGASVAGKIDQVIVAGVNAYAGGVWVEVGTAIVLEVQR